MLQIEALKQELFEKFRLRGALRSPAHITLFRPFEWKGEEEEKLISTLEKFTFDQPFNIELKNFNCFQPRVIYVDVMPNEKLDELYSSLKNYCRRNFGLYNEDDDMRGFAPHVTIANRDLKKQLFYKLWDSYQRRLYNGSFEYPGISLLRLENKWEIVRNFGIYTYSK